MSGNIPTCPVILKGEAKREWKRLTEELDNQGLINHLDRGILANYCLAWGRWVELEKQLTEFETLWIRVGVGASAQLHPRQEYRMAQDQLKVLKDLSVLLGLCPQSRQKLRTEIKQLESKKKSTKPTASKPKHLKVVS
ncbi:MAG: phage terminase small subunit P27 family [Planctomycetaceae bacterium]|nr:phage terminase small subunit P27 family [Planctomycetaceae bacterium]